MVDTDKFLRNLVLNYDLEEEERELLEHPDSMPPDYLMDAHELAKKLNVRKEYIYRLVREGKIEPIRIGRYLRFSRNWLMAIIRQTEE